MRKQIIVCDICGEQARESNKLVLENPEDEFAQRVIIDDNIMDICNECKRIIAKQRREDIQPKEIINQLK